MSEQNVAPIIIIKKKGGHGGHHGGAWKVAYADFVTAMMALFIVLWLMNSSEQVRKAISAYFQDPSGTGKQSGSSAAGLGEGVSVGKDNMATLRDKLEAALKKSPDFEKLKQYVQMSVTGEGLRVELIESEKGMFFQSGSPNPTDVGEQLIDALARELGKLPNDVLIEGHTDAQPYSGKNGYSNWELSTDRANEARKLMEAGGLRPDQVKEVRGFAAESLRLKDKPDDPSNRRVSVIVRYQSPAAVDPAADAKPGEDKPGEAKPAEAKPAEARPSGAKAAEAKAH